MPIKPEKRKLYPPDWPSISLRVRLRAGFKCELCDAVHGKPHPVTGAIVVLTVHHLDFDPTNCAWWNLIALCQRCHNRLDARTRAAHRRAEAEQGQPMIDFLEAEDERITSMDIERYNGTKERREYGTPGAMIKDAEAEARRPGTKKLTLHFPRPKLRIPGKRPAKG